jgi:hypothetical protein
MLARHGRQHFGGHRGAGGQNAPPGGFMDEIEVAVSVLAAVTLPLSASGPMLMRTLSGTCSPPSCCRAPCIVLMLTRAPGRAVLTLCVGVALLLAESALAVAAARTSTSRSRTRSSR